MIVRRPRPRAGDLLLPLIPLAAAIGVAAWGSGAAAQVIPGRPAPAEASVVASSGRAIAVAPGKSQLVTVERPFTRVMLGDPQVAEVMPLSPTSLYVLGKANGSTSLSLYDGRDRLVAVLDLDVQPDAAALRRKLAELVPGEAVEVATAGDHLVLKGRASSAPVAERIVTIAETFAGKKLVNMMGLAGAQQVLLEVRIAEVQRSRLAQIGINSAFRSDSGRFVGGTGNNATATTLGVVAPGGPVQPSIPSSQQTFASILGNVTLGSVSLTGALDALETKGLARTLAKPNLIALSGETANFLAGGEFPVPTNVTLQAGIPTVAIEFKPFGVALAFTPTVLDDGLISLVVAPEVSALDPTNAFELNGFRIPGLNVRRARTTLELRDGQSFAMAGLIQATGATTVRQFPFLGSLPVIGALFRSSGFNRNETELVITVTARLVRPTDLRALVLPTDQVREPSDADLFLMGRTERPAGDGGRQLRGGKR